MFNILGFSFVFHLVIVALWWIAKGIRHITSIAIVVGLSGIIAWSAFAAFQSIIHSTPSTLALARNTVCIPRAKKDVASSTAPQVVLRLDDVQADAWSETSRLLVAAALKRGIPMVVGVIPKGLFDDALMANFLEQERCNIEIALHGWDHGRSTGMTGEGPDAPAEFQNVSQSEATTLLKQGLAQLKRITESPITTFIPPNNIASAETVPALRSLGFTVMSSEGKRPYDYTAPTYDFNQKKIVSIEHILTLCERNFTASKPCIIMFHPQEYSQTDQQPDMRVIEEHFLGLIEALDARGVSYHTFRDLRQRDAQKRVATPSQP